MKLIPKGFHNIFLLLSAMLMYSSILSSQNNHFGGHIRKIVIDAGHGGKDPGAVGRYSKEKDIVLSVALKTGSLIKKRFPEVEIIYTRTTDDFVELYRRAEIANKAHADLFISIHCNASRNKSPYGTETFVMGLSKSKANLEVAKLENAAILYEENYAQTYDGFDPNEPETNIIFTLFQSVYREQSLRLAATLQDQFRVKSGRHDRGVKEEGFLVLYRTSMPSILTEIGFISNAEEEKYLNSPQGQDIIARAIFRSVRDYKLTMEKGIAGIEEDTPDEPVLADVPVSVNRDSGISKAPKEQNQQIFFRVQIYTSPTKLGIRHSKFKKLKDVYEYQHMGSWKYTAGRFNSEDEAHSYRRKFCQKDFKDAFVVAFFGDERISIEEAIKRIQK